MKKKWPKHRIRKLTPEEIQEFRKKHIPYRIKPLKQVIIYLNKSSDDKLWPSIYESAQIICRMFIQFFGLTVSEGKLKANTDYFPHENDISYEVKIKDVGGEFINPNNLSKEDKEILAHAYQAGSLATAHMTYKTPFEADPTIVIKASSIILNLLHEKLNYDCLI